MHIPRRRAPRDDRIVVPGALLRIVLITALATAMTTFWGWSIGAGIVFGLALAVASTVVVLRARRRLAFRPAVAVVEVTALSWA